MQQNTIVFHHIRIAISRSGYFATISRIEYGNDYLQDLVKPINELSETIRT